MYTAIVPMTRAWLLDPSNPSTSVSCGTRTSNQPTVETLDGEFRTFAGNVIQLVTRTLNSRQYPLVFAAVTNVQRQQLVDWRGITLLLRTTEGVRMYGGYLSTSTTRYLRTSVDLGATPVAYDVSVVFETVTYVEAV